MPLSVFYNSFCLEKEVDMTNFDGDFRNTDICINFVEYKKTESKVNGLIAVVHHIFPSYLTMQTVQKTSCILR